MRARAVIGACWGDEGKGLMVDHLSRPGGLVVRFNGGAQAGHTVQTPEGVRHVFHHFGAGSLRRADTLLGPAFILNPLMANLERRALVAAGAGTRVYVDGRCRLTSPYEMMVNQMAEEARGASRHGSCGLGINETIKRTEAGDWPLDIPAIFRSPEAMPLRAIRHEWVPARLRELGIEPTSAWQARLDNPAIADAWLAAMREMSQYATLVKLDEEYDLLRVAARNRALVFEGAQGLLLDQDHRFFPHVTHSHTGLRNVVELLDFAGIAELVATYITRAYATRHGQGPFPSELAGLRYDDPTNIPNEWQGTLRFGALDLDLLAEAVTNDLRWGEKIDLHAEMAITCLDQVDGDVPLRWKGCQRHAPGETVVSLVAAATGLAVRYESHGPTRATIVERRPS